jgi:DNA mismatch repair protein MSH2
VELEFDSKSESSFCMFYRGLAKSDGVIRFFDRKTFYSAHGDDALFVAAEYFHTTAVLRYLGSTATNPTSGLPSVAVSNNMFEMVVRDMLQVRNLRVELWSPSSSGGSSWQCVRRASPGNLQSFEDIFLSSTSTDFSAAVAMSVRIQIRDNQIVVGVAYADTTLRTLGVAEFLDSDRLGTLHAVAVQLGAKECIVMKESLPHFAVVNDICAQLGVVVSERPKNSFASASLESDVKKLLVSSPSCAVDLLEIPVAAEALSSLLRFLDLLGDSTNHAAFTLVRFSPSAHVRLDAAALRALHILPAAGDASKSMSLYGLLNRCRSAMGSRRLMQWIRQPLLDVSAIEERHSIVGALVEDSLLRASLQDTHLKRMPDIDRLIKRLQRGRGSLEDVVRAYQVSLHVRPIREAIESNVASADVWAQFVSVLKGCEEELAPLEEMVLTTIDMRAAEEHHEFLIAPGFDESLTDVQQQKDACLSTMNTLLQQAANDLAMDAGKTLKLEKSPVYGYVFRVTRKDERSLRDNTAKYTVLDTRKDGVLFTTSKLKRTSSEYDDLCKTYESRQGELVSKAVQVVATYVPVLQTIAHCAADLDVYAALALIASTNGYVRPRMRPQGSGVLHMVQCRHPCLEAQSISAGSGGGSLSFIPNDVHMVQGESGFVIVTGPNCGGKSTYIRQIGVVTLMAQMGSFVPCVDAEITVIDCILARVGASDAQLRGISTFMAEMLETSMILQTATKDSLVIVDELGRGTSTYDGFGLAYAISEHILQNIHCFCLFATHFHELTQLASHAAGVKNLHVTAAMSGGQLTFLYQVREGACDQSFGIHVAELVRFPVSVVETAKRKASELETFGPGNAKRARFDVQKLRGAGEGQQVSKYLEELGKIKSLPRSQQTLRLKEVMAMMESDEDPVIQAIVTHPPS